MKKFSHKMKTADGYFLHVEECGRGSPIIFAHEFGGDHRSWQSQMSSFAQDHRCIAYAARGFLPSAVPDGVAAYGQGKSTQDLIAVADRLGLAKFHLVGLSMGSFTSLMAAAQQPKRILSLTLIGCSSGPCTRAEQAEYRGYIEDEIALLEAGRARRLRSRGLRKTPPTAGCGRRSRPDGSSISIIWAGSRWTARFGP